jgi:large subunit ribosomal protein LP2
MRVIGAYMLAVLGGNKSPDAAAITSILDSIGQKPDADDLKLFLSQVEGKDIAEVIAAGSKKLAAVPTGGGGGGAAADGAAEEKKEEKKEEEEDDGGFDFDSDEEE